MRKALWTIAIAALLFGTWRLWTSSPAEADLTKPARIGADDRPGIAAFAARRGVGPDDDSPAPRGGGSLKSESLPAAAAVPLPPRNTPLRFVYTELKRRTSQGDVRAQCRLGVELHRCAQAAHVASTAKHAAQEAKRTKNNSLSTWAEKLARASEVTRGLCDGFTPDEGDRPWRHTLQAALAGNHAATVNLFFHLDSRNPAEDADGWVAFRDHAPALLRRALEDGYPPAYSMAATVSARAAHHGDTLWRGLAPPLSYYMALMTQATPGYRVALQRDIDEIRQAEKLTDDYMRAASAAAVPLAAKLKAPASGPVDYTEGIRSEIDAGECEE